MAVHGSWFTVTWTVFKNHFVEVGQTHSRETQAFPNVHDLWFILFYHVRGPTWIEIHWNSIRLRTRSHMTSHYTWRSMITLHDFGGVLGDNLRTLSFGLSQFHGHNSWLIPEVALRYSGGPLKRSVKRIWTGPAFSTNESASSVLVTGSQSRVWSGHGHRKGASVA